MANLLCSSCPIARRDEDCRGGDVGTLKRPLAVVNPRARSVARRLWLMRAPPASEQPRDGGFPCGEFAFAHGGIHVQREAALQLPMLREAIGLEKKPGVRAGEITRGQDVNFLLPRT